MDFFMPSPDVSLPKQPKVDPEFFVEAFFWGGALPLATGLAESETTLFMLQ